MNKILTFRKACDIISKLKEKGSKVVLCVGFFDILHKGHVSLLMEAKKRGDVLMVCVDCDENAKFLKESKKTINDKESRILVVSSLEPVDYAFSFPEFDGQGDINGFYRGLYQKLKPSAIATCVVGGKFGELKRKHAESISAEFIVIDRVFFEDSTTNIIKKAKNFLS